MRIRALRLGAALAGVAAAACYDPSAEIGAPCSMPGNACPSGQSCDVAQTPPTCVAGLRDGGDADAHADGPDHDASVGCSATMPCPVTAPVCDPTSQVCRGCERDGECATACEELTGECVEPAEAVIYVNGSAGGTNTGCTRAMPCATIAGGIAEVSAARTFISIAAGTYTETIDYGGSASVVLSGPGSGGVATVVGQLQLLTGPTSVVVESLSLGPQGSTCAQLSSSALTTTFYGVVVGPCSGDGIDSQGPLVVRRSQLLATGNGNAGIAMEQTGSADIEQTIIDGYINAITLAGGSFTIRNVQLSHGTSTALTVPAVAQGQSGIVDFVTIVDGRGAIECANGQGVNLGELAITSSLFARNGPSPQLSSSCPVSWSVWDDGSTPAGSNDGFGLEPVFVDESTGNYHLAPGSPGVAAADPGSTTYVDLDGAVRPQGSGFDCGAYQGSGSVTGGGG